MAPDKDLSMLGGSEDVIAAWKETLIEDSYIHPQVQCDGCQEVQSALRPAGDRKMNGSLIYPL